MVYKRGITIIMPNSLNAVTTGLYREMDKAEKDAEIEGKLWIIFIILFVIFTGMVIVC